MEGERVWGGAMGRLCLYSTYDSPGRIDVSMSAKHSVLRTMVKQTPQPSDASQQDQARYDASSP